MHCSDGYKRIRDVPVDLEERGTIMEEKESKNTSSWSTGKKVGVIVAAVIVIYALISVFFHFHFFRERKSTDINAVSTVWEK